jgi:hypothetical protein
MATLAVPAAAAPPPLVAASSFRSSKQDGSGRVSSVMAVLPAAASNSNLSLASALPYGRGIHQHRQPLLHISPMPRWLQVRGSQLQEKLQQNSRNSQVQEIQCQSSRAQQHPHCLMTRRSRLQQRVSLSSSSWLGSSSVMSSSLRRVNPMRRPLSNRPIFTVQANTGPNEPHAANLASVPEEGLRQELEDQALSLESTLRREVDVDDFLMSKLPSHPKLHRGCLENGLHYVILPNKVPPNRFEAHMEMHVGSVDEAEHEQGIAHMIEHVAFLGSKKREKLLGTGARSNAYTDFHHTVFHVHSPVTTQVAFLPRPHTHQPGFFFFQM